jgi:hypothetical protein
VTEYWKGDAETGDKSQWAKQTVKEDSRIQVVTNQVTQGKYSYRVELRPGDNPSGCRATLASGPSGKMGPVHLIRDGEEAFYGLSVYLPSATFSTLDKWRLVLQFKAYPDTGSPPISLNIKGNNWLLNYRPTATSSVLHKAKFPLTKDRWEKFMFNIKWSKDPKVGFIELYYNGDLVVPKFNTSTIHVKSGTPSINFVALGLYRDSSIKVTDVIYHDGFVAGKSYEEVAQGS